MRKVEFVAKILEILQRQTETSVDLLDIFTSNYPESYRKLRKSLKYGPSRFKSDWASKYLEYHRFYSILNKLKNEGLIEKKKSGFRFSIWKITKKGLEKLKFFQKNKKKEPSELFNIKEYKKESDNKLKIFIFDIPESERRKRTWLRIALISLGFSKLQQSVWIGKNKIPSDFISDLKQKEMLDYIHIFEISKKGTINESL